ncbi:MAG: hypothetical protein IJU25_04180, partial [Lachnospiraceae bacterium]|nr:hypothetical protein [Lachnospiraceae bacterium]
MGVLLFIQYVSIILLFVESWIIFRNYRGYLHAYLLFACVSSLINAIGYLMELKAVTEEGYLIALKFSYV